MLATFGSNESRPNYADGQLKENNFHLVTLSCKTPDNKKNELRNITCANAHLRVQRQVLEFESRYITLSMKAGFLNTVTSCH
jgi:hypothetical protein